MIIPANVLRLGLIHGWLGICFECGTDDHWGRPLALCHKWDREDWCPMGDRKSDPVLAVVLKASCWKPWTCHLIALATVRSHPWLSSKPLLQEVTQDSGYFATWPPGTQGTAKAREERAGCPTMCLQNPEGLLKTFLHATER